MELLDNSVNLNTQFDSLIKNVCSICLEPLLLHDLPIAKGDKCNHYFHQEHLMTHIDCQKMNGKPPFCPNCRAPIDEVLKVNFSI